MQYWQLPYLGIRQVPRELTQFELHAFFTFTPEQQTVILGRRESLHKLGLALHLGFLRMAGRPLAAFRVIPKNLLSHLGDVLALDEVPDIASLRSLYRRVKTLFEHQQLACDMLGFARMTEHRRRALTRFLRQEAQWEFDRDRLLGRTHQWLYENKTLIEHERALRSAIDKAVDENETAMAGALHAAMPAAVLTRWAQTLESRHAASGGPVQTWLWSPPLKHSVGQLTVQFSKIAFLTELEVTQHPLNTLTDHAIRYYAQRRAERPPSVGRRIKEPRQTIEVVCFLQAALMSTTDNLVAMIRQRIVDLWNQAARKVHARQAERNQMLVWLAKTVRTLAEDRTLSEADLRQKLLAAVDHAAVSNTLSKAGMTREKLLESSRGIRALLVRLVELPIESAGPHPVREALTVLATAYRSKTYRLPADVAIDLGSVWKNSLDGDNRERVFQAFEIATLLGLRRALKNGLVFIAHSFSYRARESMLIPKEEWASKQAMYLSKLKLPADPKEFTAPLVQAAQARLYALAETVKQGKVSIDDEVHLTALATEPETRETTEARRILHSKIPDAELPHVILDVDSQVRFSWILLGREPRSLEELLLLYAGLLAQATAHSAADIGRMITGLSPEAIKRSTRWLQEEPRVTEANAAVFDFMHRHAIAAHWGRPDLASADMMSLETSFRNLMLCFGMLCLLTVASVVNADAQLAKILQLKVFSNGSTDGSGVTIFAFYQQTGGGQGYITNTSANPLVIMALTSAFQSGQYAVLAKRAANDTIDLVDQYGYLTQGGAFSNLELYQTPPTGANQQVPYNLYITPSLINYSLTADPTCANPPNNCTTSGQYVGGNFVTYFWSGGLEPGMMTALYSAFFSQSQFEEHDAAPPTEFTIQTFPFSFQ